MPNGGWANSTRKQRLPKDWPTLRRAVLQRDGYRCQLGYPGTCTYLATDADHVVHGDDHSMTNLQAACGPCHRAKSSSEGGRAAQQAKARRRRPPTRHPGLIR